MSGGTRRLWLVARREWNQRARTTAFRVSTLISIGVVVLLIMVPEIYGGGDKPTRTVGLVGVSSPQLPEVLKATGEQLDLTVKTREFADEDAGRTALRADDVAVLLVDQRALAWKSEVDEELRTTVISAVAVLERQAAIDELGLTAEEAGRLLQPPDVRSTSLDPTTKEETARADLGRIGVVMLFLMIAFYGGFVLMGVVEEKSSRVIEVLLSRVRPAELLAGKILGIGLVGLAQFALVVAAALVALSATDNTQIPATAWGTLGWIVFWFVLGYGFYSVLYAAAGSLVSRQEETQSLVLPMTIVQLVAYFLAFISTESPDGGAAVVGSLFPPTAPMVMIVRIAHGGVPLWQAVLRRGADGGHGLRHGGPGGTDLRRRGAPLRRPGAAEGGLARRRGVRRRPIETRANDSRRRRRSAGSWALRRAGVIPCRPSRTRRAGSSSTGASPSPASRGSPRPHASNGVYRRLRDRGYEVFAVNPNADEVEGEPCYHDLKSIPGGVEGMVIGTRPELAEDTMRECVELGITNVWMHRGPGGGSVSEAATEYGREHGVLVIDGGCPLMFGPTADVGHKVSASCSERPGTCLRRCEEGRSRPDPQRAPR